MATGGVENAKAPTAKSSLFLLFSSEEKNCTLFSKK
jgi:hypothetical protein